MADRSAEITNNQTVRAGIPLSMATHLDFLDDWGVLATDADLKITIWNSWLVQRSGIQASKVLGQPLFEVFPDLASRGIDRVYSQVLAGLPVVRSQSLHSYLLAIPSTLFASGKNLMQQSVRIFPLINGDAVCGTITLINDVTERVVYESELNARARRQAAIASAAKAALAGKEVDDIACEMVDLIAETLEADFEEILECIPESYSLARIAGRGWTTSVPTIFEAEIEAFRHANLATSGVLESEDVVNDPRFQNHSSLHENGVRAALIVRVSGRTDQPFGFIGVYSQATRRFSTDEMEFVSSLANVLGISGERKRLEAELRVRVSELAEADRRKDEFLAMLAHELRNPLAPVRNGLLILRLTEDNPQVQRHTRDMIDRQVHHLSRLVDDLLDVSRITREKLS